MADVAVFLHHGIGTGKTMHDASILQIGAALENEPAEIAAQAGRRTDIALRPDDHIADQDGGRMDVGRRVDHWGNAIDCVNFDHVH